MMLMHFDLKLDKVKDRTQNYLICSGPVSWLSCCINLTCIHPVCLFICLFGVLRRFQNCTGHITMGSWKGRGNQFIEFARVVYCKLPTNGKKLPGFPLTAMTGIEPWPQRWEARVLPLCHRGPLVSILWT